MKRRNPNTRPEPMSADAYAGFLKLWLTPSSRPLHPSADVDAYIEHANRVDPLPARVRRTLGQPTHHAA